jgi:hypothetical protein
VPPGAVAAFRTPPDQVPYVPLGVRNDHIFLLDAGGHFQAIRCRDLNRPRLISLFGAGEQAISRLYPRWTRDRDTKAWKQDEAGRFDSDAAIVDLVRRCRGAGTFDPEKQLRGRGAWTDDEGRLVVHLGDRIVVAGRQTKLIALHGFGYLRAPALPALPRMSVSSSHAPGAWLVEQFGRCRWQHRRLAPLLMTGAVALAPLNGVLPIHPVLAIGGSVRWGAQEVLRMIGSVLGPFVAIAYEADEMRISEAVGWDSWAVLIDPSRGGSSARLWRPPRAPSWVGETAAVRTRPYGGMRFCLAGTANRLSLRDDPSFLELALSGRPLSALAPASRRSA